MGARSFSRFDAVKAAFALNEIDTLHVKIYSGYGKWRFEFRVRTPDWVRMKKDDYVVFDHKSEVIKKGIYVKQALVTEHDMCRAGLSYAWLLVPLAIVCLWMILNSWCVSRNVNG
jgi:cytolysin (calcineurin-like family phosphatase)